MGFINVEQLVASRTAKGWDQRHLADAAGIHRSIISRMERGLQLDCRVSVLVAIATALEVPLESLVQTDHQVEMREQSPDLVATLGRLHQQPVAVQQWAAGIINAFLAGLEG